MLRMFMAQEAADRIALARKTILVPSAAQLDAFRQAMKTRPTLASKTEGARAMNGTPENYAVVGNTAQIAVLGCLTEEEDFWCWLLGMQQTSYADIRDAYALAAADPAVTNVRMLVASPGGYTDGMFETLAAIERFAKPIAVDASRACSAAYALSAMAGKINALGPAAEFGSVGVCRTYWIDPEHEVDIASREAPRKRPDLTTDAGKAMVQDELDALHQLFVEAIARGRTHATGTKFTVEKINAEFGRGGTLLAKEAAAAGMIDKVPKPPKRGTAALSDSGSQASVAGVARTAAAESEYELGDRVRVRDGMAHDDMTAGKTGTIKEISTAALGIKFDGMDSIHHWYVDSEIEPADEAKEASADGGMNPKGSAKVVPLNTPTPRASGQGKKTMTKEELKAQHPEVYASIYQDGVAAGEASGAEKATVAERKRVNAHLKMGETSGAMKVAIAAISSGASLFDEEVHAEYMTASMNRRDQDARQEDSDTANAATSGAKKVASTEGAKDRGDLVAAAMGLPAPKAQPQAS